MHHERKQKNPVGSANSPVLRILADAIRGSFSFSRHPARHERSPNTDRSHILMAHPSNSRRNAHTPRRPLLLRLKDWQSCQRLFRDSIRIHSLRKSCHGYSELRTCCGDREFSLGSRRRSVLDVGSLQASQRVRFQKVVFVEILVVASCFFGFLVSNECSGSS